MKRWRRKLSKPSQWRGSAAGAGDDGLSPPQIDDSRPIDTQGFLCRIEFLLPCLHDLPHLSAGQLSMGADCVAVLACLLSIIGILQSSVYHRRLIWYSCIIGILLSFFWYYYMIRMPKFRWDIIWLPVAPLSLAGVCLHVDRLLNESSQEVRKLRNYMYAYKAR